MIKKSSKPIFYTGGGVINSGPKASELLRELISLTGFPITSTFKDWEHILVMIPIFRNAWHARNL